MLWLDVNYLKQISYRLQGFKEKKIGTLFNCKCPICGDSSKKANKKRGYFMEYKGSLVYKCHNCNVSMSFGRFLKQFDINLYDRYTLDRYKNGANHQDTKKDEDIFDLIKQLSPPETKRYIPNIVAGLKSVDELNEEHPVLQYVKDRKIPEKFWSTLYYAPKFFKWASNNTDKFRESKQDHPRLIIPWFSSDGVMFAYTARAFGKEEPKYYKVIVDETYPPFYGLDRLNKTDQSYVVEGPLDSLFIPNCVAVGTSSLHMYQNPAAIYITDRDVRNKEIMKECKTLIKSGYRVCMLPDNLPGKDINEFVQNGLNEKEVLDIINQNTYQGLEAELKFTSWSKV